MLRVGRGGVDAFGFGHTPTLWFPGDSEVQERILGWRGAVRIHPPGLGKGALKRRSSLK